MPTGPGVIRRKLATARRMGPRATVERLTEGALARVHVSEDHVWYELDLAGERPKLALPEGVRLRRATAAELHRVAELGRSVAQVESWHAEGHELWLALEEASNDLLYCIWTFHGRAPALAAPGGWFDLPPRTACSEGAVTSSRVRGRGIAPASAVAIADALQQEGVGSIIRKIAVGNEAARRVVVKAGCHEIGVMHLRTLGPRRRVWFTSVNGAMGRELEQRLGSRATERRAR
jgi:RimJ/RimL family protein N-acetyltransferase